MVWFTADVFIEYQRTRRQFGTSAEELGLSDYRHFVIYPRLDKALKAQKNNDEATAIREFEYIHQQVPDNIPLTLYLAEAYRHFGHDDRARLLLEDQLETSPRRCPT